MIRRCVNCGRRVTEPECASAAQNRSRSAIYWYANCRQRVQQECQQHLWAVLSPELASDTFTRIALHEWLQV